MLIQMLPPIPHANTIDSTIRKNVGVTLSLLMALKTALSNEGKTRMWL